jgi:hypothetical protein
MMVNDRDYFFRELLNGSDMDEWEGDQESPTGYFGHITIANIEEAVELHEAVYGVAPTFSEREAMARPEAFSNPGVVGNFVVKIDSDGNVTVARFSTIAEKLAAYEELTKAYMAWAETA